MKYKQKKPGYKNSWSYYNDLEEFCIYFYKLLRRQDPKAYKVKTNEEVIEFYQSDPSHLEFITSQWNIRRKIANKSQSKKAAISGANNKKNGIFGTANSKAQQALNESGWYGSEKQIESSKRSGTKGGKIAGANNVASGHWDKLLNEYATFETRSRGGKTSGANNLASGHWTTIQKLATTASVKARANKKKDKIQSIVNFLPKDSEFLGSAVKEACIKAGYHADYYKTVLRRTDFIERTYHGKNQFDPSKYKIIK